jgi:hypothetical protein
VPFDLLQKPEVVAQLLENNPKFLRYFAQMDKEFLARLVQEHSRAVRKIVNGNRELLQEFPELADKLRGSAWDRLKDAVSRGRKKYVVSRPRPD